jgi:O-antigen ligase
LGVRAAAEADLLTMSVETARRPEALASISGMDRLDMAGLALVVAAVVWTFLAAAWSGGNPWPVGASFVLVAAAFVAGRVAADLNRSVVPAVVVVGAVILAVLTWGNAFGPGVDRGPLGYENAMAAFLVEAAVAALMLAVATRSRYVRGFAFAAAVAFAVSPLAIKAGAASFVLVLIPAVAAFALQRRPPRVVVLGSALLVLVSVAATVVVAAGGPRSRAGALASQALDQRRVLLWSDALRLMADRPLAGVGPGRFEVESPTARRDYDARWAHNGFLQHGAETGVIGLGLLVLLFGWGFARLLSGEDQGLAVLGAFALAAVGVLACLDYVLHFPAITLTGSVLVGAASSGPRGPTASSLEEGR